GVWADAVKGPLRIEVSLFPLLSGSGNRHEEGARPALFLRLRRNAVVVEPEMSHGGVKRRIEDGVFDCDLRHEVYLSSPAARLGAADSFRNEFNIWHNIGATCRGRGLTARPG